MPEPSLLLLIPAYNEEARIEPMLREFADFFGRNYSGQLQLVVVLNGCRDNTFGVVERVAKDFPVVSWLDFPAAIGKGGALIEGLKLASHADFYMKAHWFHGKLSFALVVIALHHVIGARAKRAAAGSVQPGGASATLSVALVGAAFVTVLFAIYKTDLVR